MKSGRCKYCLAFLVLSVLTFAGLLSPARAQSATAIVHVPPALDRPGSLGTLVAKVAGRRSSILRSIPALHMYRVELAPGTSALTRPGALPETGPDWIEPECDVHLLDTPNDPFFGRQWWANAVNLPPVWDRMASSRSVTVAVLDSGLNPAAADLGDRVVAPYSVTLDSGASWAWQDTQGHGTMVAAIIAAQGDDGVGIAGTNWGAAIMPVKLGDGDSFSDFDCAAAIVYATDHGARVVNMSWGCDGYSQPISAALDYAHVRGVLLVASAGNGSSGAVMYPASDKNVIAVTSTDAQNNLAHFSSQGPEADLSAPGDGVATVDLFGRLAVVSGTSFSAPMVTGVASLLLSVKPDMTSGVVEQVLRETSRDLGAPGNDPQFGYGMVDAESALNRVAPRPTTTTTVPTTTTLRSTTTTLPSATTTTSRFSDVGPAEPYAAAITDFADRGIISGFPDGSFQPSAPVSRQQFAKLVVMSLGLPTSESDPCAFGDVAHYPTELYPYHYVGVASSHDITNGTSNNPPLFSPWSMVSRAQAITMVARAANLADPPAGYEPPFPDFSPQHYPWARKAAFFGLMNGLQGAGQNYGFWQPASRGETAQMLHSLLRLKGG